VAAGLENHAVATDRFDHRATLGNRQRHRLFAVNVLTSFGGHNGHHRMPVVGRDNSDGVNIIAGQKLAEIHVCSAFFEDTRLFLAAIVVFDYSLSTQSPKIVAFPPIPVPMPVLPAARHNVADSDNLHIAMSHERPHIIRAHPAGVDTAHHNSIAGRIGP